MQPATPIIVVGKNRSGTKWLSNILSNHSQVASVQSERHTGILETNAFSILPAAFGDLARPDNYIAFVSAWTQTDFYRHAGCDPELLLAAKPRPTRYLDAFRLVMDDMAARRGAARWLQKCSPLDADAVLAHFTAPRARDASAVVGVVVIRREMRDTLRSTVQNARDAGADDSAARAAFRYVLEDRLEDEVIRRHAPVRTSYEALRADPDAESARVCAGLGLAFEPGMTAVRFRANTSFAHARRGDALTARDLRTIDVVARAGRLLPTSALVALRERMRDKRPIFVRGSYREIAERYGIE